MTPNGHVELRAEIRHLRRQVDALQAACAIYQHEAAVKEHLMPTHTSRTITSTRREWTLPVPRGGATVGDLTAALDAAAATWRQDRNLPAEAPAPVDFAQVWAGDDCIIISYTVEDDR